LKRVKDDIKTENYQRDKQVWFLKNVHAKRVRKQKEDDKQDY